MFNTCPRFIYSKVCATLVATAEYLHCRRAATIWNDELIKRDIVQLESRSNVSLSNTHPHAYSHRPTAHAILVQRTAVPWPLPPQPPPQPWAWHSARAIRCSSLSGSQYVRTPDWYGWYDWYDCPRCAVHPVVQRPPAVSTTAPTAAPDAPCGRHRHRQWQQRRWRQSLHHTIARTSRCVIIHAHRSATEQPVVRLIPSHACGLLVTD